MSTHDYKDWLIDPARTRVIVLAFPHGGWNRQLQDWVVRRFPPNLDKRNWVTVTVRGVMRARNSAVRDLVLRPDAAPFDHFVFIDRDVKPDGRADRMFTTKGDIVACQHPMANPQGWSDPHVMHCGLWRADRAVFEKLWDGKRPLFALEYTADGCEVAKCECVRFSDLAAAAGLSVVQAGWCDHPSGDGEGGGFH